MKSKKNRRKGMRWKVLKTIDTYVSYKDKLVKDKHSDKQFIQKNLIFRGYRGDDMLIAMRLKGFPNPEIVDQIAKNTGSDIERAEKLVETFVQAMIDLQRKGKPVATFNLCEPENKKKEERQIHEDSGVDL